MINRWYSILNDKGKNPDSRRKAQWRKAPMEEKNEKVPIGKKKQIREKRKWEKLNDHIFFNAIITKLCLIIQNLSKCKR